MALETTVFGMNGTGDWGHPDHRPKSYREMAFKLFPDAPTPFTYILSKLPTKTVTDPEFKIFEDRLPIQTCVLKTTSIATTRALANAGIVLTLKNSTDVSTLPAYPAHNFKVGDVLEVEDYSGANDREHVRVTAVDSAGQTLTVIRYWGFTSADTGGPTDETQSTGGAGDGVITAGDVLRWVGSVDPEGNGAPTAISKRSTVVSNYTEIFKDSAALTGTAAATDFRPMKDQFAELKQQALLRHMMKLEWAFLLGRPNEQTIVNDYSDSTYARSTGGFRTFVERAGYLTDFAGAVALDDVEDGLRDVFKYGSKKRLGVIGYQALNILNRLVRDSSTWYYSGEAKEAKQTYGLTVFTLRCPFGELNLVPHPLLAESAQYTNDLFIMDTKYLEYVTLRGRDTKWHDKAEANDEDSRRGYWQTEAGLRLAMPECHAVWTGLSALAP